MAAQAPAFLGAHWACKGQPGDQAQPAWVHERQVLLTNLISCYD